MVGVKHTKGVVDLTFMEIAAEEQLLDLMKSGCETQIKSPKKAGVLTGEGFGTTAGGEEKQMAEPPARAKPPGSPPRRDNAPEVVKAVRLANNLITNMGVLCSPMMQCCDTQNILWFDLSFNQINVVGSETFTSTFPNVATIYLHANNISKLSQLKKLKMYPNLKSLTLYGNPIEEHKHYRNYVLHMCPNLAQFDSSPVTGSERKRNEVWAQTFRRVVNKEEDEY